jgi:S1-C subfamily serine protease
LEELQADDPARIGPYELTARLGAGGMGRVYLGQSPGGRLVAVKVIHPQLARDKEFRARFAREVTVARTVGGFFTVPVVDADTEAAQPWLATGYIDGPSLEDAVAEHGSMPGPSLLAVAAGLAEGLSAIHAAGIVHRDLKPSNVLLAPDGVRVIDFGIARAAEHTKMTGTGDVIGTAGFMSPEQAVGGDVGPASDIFSMGGVLIFAASRDGPFGRGSAPQLLYRVVHEVPRLDSLPGQLRGLVTRCMDKDADRRPDARQLLAELSRLMPARKGGVAAIDWWPATPEPVTTAGPPTPGPVGTARAMTGPEPGEPATEPMASRAAELRPDPAVREDPAPREPAAHGRGNAGNYHVTTFRRRRGRRLVAGAAVLIAASYLGIAAVTQTFPFGRSPAVNLSALSRAVPRPGSTPLGGETEIIAKVKPGVVVITADDQYANETTHGTGMVINADGLVLTNNTIIADSTKLAATVVATGKTYTATLVGYSKSADVALIQLQNASALAVVPVGDSSSVKTKEPVVAFGSPQGKITVATTSGQVTGLDKTITASDQHISAETLHGMIQTNTAAVAGDEGGPVAGSTGVIGMNTASSQASSQQAASSYVIPINTALAVASQIAAGHASSTIVIGYRGFVGIITAGGSSSSPQTQFQQWKPKAGSGSTRACYAEGATPGSPSVIAPVHSGTLVLGAICATPAASAGLTGGVVITAVNGQAVSSPNSLSSILSRFHPGDTISLTWVSPSGKRTTSSLRLTAAPPQ